MTPAEIKIATELLSMRDRLNGLIVSCCTPMPGENVQINGYTFAGLPEGTTQDVQQYLQSLLILKRDELESRLIRMGVSLT